METGLIFDIQGYSVHDGPGCRTLVFLNGCPLRCSWCSNPEGQLLRPRLLYRGHKCGSACGAGERRCLAACPHEAIRPTGANPPLHFDRSRCDACTTMACVQSCWSQALQVAGRYYTVDELIRVLHRDQDFWGQQGGVSFTGGEPLLQKDFLLAVLKKCRSDYIHAALETSAYAETALLLQASQWVDWLFIDVKHMDSPAHRQATGVGNEPILENIAALVAARWPGRLVIRIPLVPGFNDGPANLQATADFVAGLGLSEVNLLPFHRLGNSKYAQLGLEYAHAGQAAPSSEEMRGAGEVFERRGLRCYVGAETPF